MHDEVLPNKKVIFYDPQEGGKAISYEQAATRYRLDRTYFMKPNNE